MRHFISYSVVALAMIGIAVEHSAGQGFGDGPRVGNAYGRAFDRGTAAGLYPAFDRSGFGGGTFGGANLVERGLGGAGLGRGGFEYRPAFDNRQFENGPPRSPLSDFIRRPADEGLHSLRSPQDRAAEYGDKLGVDRGPIDGFARVSPSGRYMTAVGVRKNYNHWDVYGGRWFSAHPGAWCATGWAAGTAWRTASWDTASDWLGYKATPMYYDYGTNVTFQDGTVYVNGKSAGSGEEYHNQATTLATQGAKAKAPADGDWLPLGVFALSKNSAATADVVIQLAVNKAGVVRGNYTDTVTNKTQLIAGSVDKETQRVALQVGDNQTAILETGLYNLTKDEAPALVHASKDRTEQWLLVRMNKGGTPETAVSR